MRLPHRNTKKGAYKIVFNSDDVDFGGEGKGNKGKLKTESINMHGFEQSISLDLPPMSAIYIKKQGSLVPVRCKAEAKAFKGG